MSIIDVSSPIRMSSFDPFQQRPDLTLALIDDRIAVKSAVPINHALTRSSINSSDTAKYNGNQRLQKNLVSQEITDAVAMGLNANNT